MPATLIRPSTCPWASVTAAGRATTAVRSVMSSGWMVSRSPAPASSAVSSRPVLLRSTAATRAPRASRPSATSRPMPFAAPVTTKTLSLISMVPSSVVAGHVPGGAESEHDGRADGRAGTRVGPAHHRGRVVAGRVEAFEHRPVLAQRPAFGVGEHTALGAEVADDDLDRGERSPLQRAEVGVRVDRRVAVVAVVRRVAAPEVGVDAGAGEAVEALDRRRPGGPGRRRSSLPAPPACRPSRRRLRAASPSWPAGPAGSCAGSGGRAGGRRSSSTARPCRVRACGGRGRRRTPTRWRSGRPGRRP